MALCKKKDELQDLNKQIASKNVENASILQKLLQEREDNAREIDQLSHELE